MWVCCGQVNHFPDTWCIGRKDRLARVLARKQRQHPAAFDFMAKSYVLPYDADELVRDLDAHPKVRRGRSKPACDQP